MTKPPEPPRPPIHPNPTLRAQIAAGPKFEDTPEPGLCLACGEEGDIDTDTGLCRPCWRAWRWSPTRERLNPYAEAVGPIPAQEPTRETR